MKAIAILGVLTLLSVNTLQAEELNPSTNNQYVAETVSLTELVSHIQKETQAIVDAFSTQDFDLAEPALQSLGEYLLILSSLPKDYLAADPLVQEDLLSCRAALWDTFWTLNLDSPEAQVLHTTLDLFTECHTYSRSTEAPEIDEEVIEIIQSSVDAAELPYFDFICVKNNPKKNGKKSSVSKKTLSSTRVQYSNQKPKQQGGYYTLQSSPPKKTRHRDPQILLIRNRHEDSGEASVKGGVTFDIGGEGNIYPYVEGEYEDKHGNYVKGGVSKKNNGRYAGNVEGGKKKKSERGRSEEE